MKSLLVALLLLASPAQAQETTCLKSPDWTSFLTSSLHGVLVGHGTTAHERAGGPTTVELWVAADGNWALIIVFPEGVSCLVGAGKNWGAPGEPT